MSEADLYSQQDITTKLNDWLENFVEVPHPALNDWSPCPYARKARLDNRVKIVFDDPKNIQNYEHFLDDNDVVVLCFDATTITVSQLTELSVKHNSIFKDQDLVVLEDHPDNPEYINGVKMNFGISGLYILQRLSKLNEASDLLKKSGYYQVWSQDNLDEVVNWRK